jgi:hypothetical protein
MSRGAAGSEDVEEADPVEQVEEEECKGEHGPAGGRINGCWSGE